MHASTPFVLSVYNSDKVAMLGTEKIEFSSKIYMKIEFSSQRRGKLLFLTTWPP